MSSKKRDHKQLKPMSTPTKSPPRKKQNTTSPIQICNELINTFDNGITYIVQSNNFVQ